ncbi:energy-coupled thiamine transporter ThiT [Metabacillus sp. B2-18]|uniref:energy-coupled thiamine transporter ThiT n=1 Tax=Metabacillus sp. B2-18 TaxID=2897333 RepID=UPI001E385E5F|nr:energy-coupled thiamine transporter ThiT [Metabacillus sp. B2-18]UGB29935.1 energy-coupled thiamine transporter ThiT [Metabacillus sp. B2-18]
MRGNQRLLFLIEVAMLASLAFLLDLLSSVIGKLPQGGSISLGMIPIFIIAYGWGIKGGLLTGLLLGLLQAVLGNPYIVHPVQGFLDYYLAFTVVGFSGVFFKQIQNAFQNNSKKLAILYITLGALLGSLLRMVAHVVAGVAFFASFAPEGTPVLTYSIVYNASYMIPTMIVSAIVVSLLLVTSPRLIIRK